LNPGVTGKNTRTGRAPTELKKIKISTNRKKKLRKTCKIIEELHTDNRSQ
jgi:hypothetical protein